ncbi:hypothetical protein KEF29_03600 [Streptomyces tuirus]|uniref:Uncharacterized protein n=1 Tax=Streptomyces tuirus TaxID=68278 RepID=A0A941FE28_9ACTN|nr:hypothetical protein [Streptomyces tuirus]
MATVAEPRPLADLEQDALARVEAEFARRSRGAKPWTVAEYLDQIAAEHARFKAAAIARTRLGRAA